MQKLTAAIARLWNAGCLGKIAIGFITLVILSCVGAALGGRPTARQAAVPTAAPATALLPTSAPRPTRTPLPTTAPTSLPSPSPIPTTIPAPTFVLKGVAPVGSACPAEAPVKGNIVDRGARKGDKIYHVPGSSAYQQTKPERCFATATDAEDAGYRAPR